MYKGTLIEDLMQLAEKHGIRKEAEPLIVAAYNIGKAEGRTQELKASLEAIDRITRPEEPGDIRRSQGISDFALDNFNLGGNLNG